MAEAGDSRAPGATGPCHRHAENTLSAGRRKRWATRVLEDRVTGDAISLPPQEGRGRAVTSSPPARVPNPSTQCLALPRDCRGRSSTFPGLHPEPALPSAPHGKKSLCGSHSKKKVVSSLHEEQLWDGLWIVSSGSPNSTQGYSHRRIITEARDAPLGPQVPPPPRQNLSLRPPSLSGGEGRRNSKPPRLLGS